MGCCMLMVCGVSLTPSLTANAQEDNTADKVIDTANTEASNAVEGVKTVAEKTSTEGEAKAASKEDEAPDLTKAVDEWFGKYLTSNFEKVLAYPLMSRKIVPVYEKKISVSKEAPEKFDEFTSEAMNLKMELAKAGFITFHDLDKPDLQKGKLEGGIVLKVSAAQYVDALEWLKKAGHPVIELVDLYKGPGAEVERIINELNKSGIAYSKGEPDENGIILLKSSTKAYEQAVGVVHALKLEAIGLPSTGGIWIIVATLIVGGIFFTIRFGLVNLRLFGHSIQVIRGKYDNPDDEGEISHFQALTSALSATVGLGNIAGVAVAIGLGGPGAVFWMWFIAFFGMSTKFSSCSLAQLYRRIKKDGSVLGGPMIYLQDGIKELYPSLAWLGKIFAVLFAVFTIGASFGGGNMFQSNQSFSVIKGQIWEADAIVPEAVPWIFGITLAFLTGLVLLGGIKRIGSVTSKLVPAMCGFYCIVCLIIILMNVDEVPVMFASIFTEAFNGPALFGGFLGVLAMGAQRAAFSNEAGLGSAAIAHAAAKTDEPVREGVVAMIGPFIDTIVVCTMTALAILITSAHLDKTGVPYAEMQGVEITARAFESLGGAVPLVLCVAVFIFAYSTIISWSYYGEKATEYLFGEGAIMPYRLIYVFVVILGPVLSLGNVLGFSDMMLFSMAFPNIIGMIMLSPIVARKLKQYVKRLKAGEMKEYK